MRRILAKYMPAQSRGNTSLTAGNLSRAVPNPKRRTPDLLISRKYFNVCSTLSFALKTCSDGLREVSESVSYQVRDNLASRRECHMCDAVGQELAHPLISLKASWSIIFF